MSATEPDWKDAFLAILEQLHNALDVIEAIDSECQLSGHLKDLVDQALVPRRQWAK